MKFTIGTISNFQDYSEDLRLIKSSILYADEIELIGMVEYAVFRYIPSIIDNKKDLAETISSLVALLRSVNIPGKEALLEQMEVLQSQLLSISPFLKQKSHRSTQVLKAQYQARQLQNQIIGQMRSAIQGINDHPYAKELEELVNKSLVSIFDYGIEGLDTLQLAGGYFGSLMGTLYSGHSYPLFDDASRRIIEEVSTTRLINISSLRPDVMSHAGVATNILMTLPTLETASFDELVSLKEENAEALSRFRMAIYSFSSKIESLPWSPDFEYECLKLYNTEVVPMLLEINETLTETSVLKNLGRQVLDDEEARKKAGYIAGGLAGAITTSSSFKVAIHRILGLIITSFVSSQAVSSFLKVLNMGVKSYDESKDDKKEARKNQMYYYHLASKL